MWQKTVMRLKLEILRRDCRYIYCFLAVSRYSVKLNYKKNVVSSLGLMINLMSADRTTLSALCYNSGDNGRLNCPGTLAALRYARTSPNEQLIITPSLSHLH